MSPHPTTQNTSRRRFMQAGAAGMLASGTLLRGEEVRQRPTIGLQIAPFNIFDEGVDACLERVDDVAAVNTLFVYSHTYYGIPYTRTANVLADDHGYRPRNDKDRSLWPVWVRHNPKEFSETTLKFKAQPKNTEHYGRDVFAETIEPARRRGIKVYARLLEPGRLDVQGRIANYDDVTSIDLFGKLANQPCRQNPNYRAWCQAMVRDLYRNYDLDGYQWGAERIGPLAGLLSQGAAPGCFCDYCQKRAQEEGVDPSRARQGFTEMHDLIQSVGKRNARPSKGVMNTLLGIVIKYPEVIAWEHLWRIGVEEVAESIYTTIKSIKPSAQVGRHIDSKGTTLNPVTRAGTDYLAMANYSDFIKPILYHDVMAPRIVDHFLNRWRAGTFSELDQDTLYEVFLAFNGYQSLKLPMVSQLFHTSLPAEYVGHETQRLVEEVSGQADILPGIGMDVPHRSGGLFTRSPQDFEVLGETIRLSKEAGAGGVVASREYDEMRMPTLKAFGDAVRKHFG